MPETTSHYGTFEEPRDNPQSDVFDPKKIETPKRKKGIVVERMEDYISPPPEDYYDSMEQWMQEDYERYLAEHGEPPPEEPLPYEPFDARQGLKEIRTFSNKEQSLSKKEKREIIKHRVEEFKDRLNSQKLGIAKTIRELGGLIENNPDISSEDLMSKIEAGSADYRFTKYQVHLFEFATDEYRKKHQAVEKYRTLYPDNADLFEACFGKKPKGEVEVQKGAMTLLFRCFDEGDYSFIYNQGSVADEKKDSQEKISEANNTGGIALGKVKIEELGGVITVENVNSNKKYEVLKAVPKVERLGKDESFTCDIYNQEKDIKIEVVGVGSWTLRLFEPDAFGVVQRMQLVSATEPEQKPIFDVIRIEPSEKTHWIPFLRQVGDNKTNYQNEVGQLRSGNKSYGWVDVDYSEIKFRNSSGQVLVIERAEDEIVVSFDKDKQRSTRAHEDQHQFNRLFSPYEKKQTMLEIMQGAVERTEDPDKAIDFIIHGLVKYRRVDLLDTRVRDEILAFYKDGRNPGDILKILRDAKIYDYVSQAYTKEQMSHIPESVKEDMKREMTEFFYDEDYGYSAINELEIDLELVKPHIASAFGDEYKQDLGKWMNAVSVLEEKGYAREEVVSLLYQEPVNSWSNLARRMNPKAK